MTQFSKRAMIILIWLAFLVAINVVFFNVETRICNEEARDELLDLSVTVSGQISVITENDYYTQIGSSKMEYAKLKALSLGLDLVSDPEGQRGIVEEFAKVANVEGLIVYDREANIIYSSGNTSGIALDDAIIREALDDHVFDNMDQTLEITESDRDKYLSTAYINKINEGIYAWNANNNRWLIVSGRRETNAENHLLDYFSWRNVLSGITIGRTGYVVAVDDEDGTVLSCPDRDYAGKPVEEMDIRIGDNSGSAALAELTGVFSQPYQITRIRIGEKGYYATRLKEDHTLMLAVLPEEEIREDVVNATSLLFVLVALFSGICVLFAFIHIQDTEDFKRKPRGRYAWNGVLAGRLKVMSVLTCIVLFVSGIYLEALAAYADTFRYTSTKVNGVVDLLKSNGDATKMMDDWSRDEYLAKCRIIRCILDRVPKESRTRAFLADLSDRLDVRSICLYDAKGNIRLTDSPYDPDPLLKTDPFYSLLKGRSELVGAPEEDKETGEARQRAGMTLLNEENECDGLILIVTDPTRLKRIEENLGFGGVFEQISLKDESFVMAIRASDMTIRYLAEVQDGRHRLGMDLFDYTGYPISEMGISEQELQDHYNGNLFVLKNRYFASVRRLDDNFLLVMRPQIRFDAVYLEPVVIAVIGTLLFAVLLIVFSCLERKETAIRQERASAGAAKAKREAAGEFRHRDDDLIAVLGSLMNRKKPYFERRWPEDCIKWKDKTTDQKFRASLKYFMILALTAIFIHAVTAGEGSVWYYCFNGHWDNGINLYSLTKSLISVCMLFVIKLVLHKLLFWLARVVRPRAETFCCLLDSFSGYFLATAGIFICLSHFGVGATTLSLTGGVAGVVFGIGCQNIVADILAGILMVCEGNVCVGDYVSYDGRYGVVLSIGVRTTRLIWFSEETIVRNNDFKNYINMPAEVDDRVVTEICIDLHESLERVEMVLKTELPVIEKRMCQLTGAEIEGPKYRGVKEITANGVVLSFSVFCSGMYYGIASRMLNRELKLMCERNGINLAMQQVVVNEPKAYPNLQGSESGIAIHELPIDRNA